MGKKARRGPSSSVSGVGTSKAATAATTTPAAAASSDTSPTASFFSSLGTVLSLSFTLLKLCISIAISAPFWFLTYSLSVPFGRPPKLQSLSQSWRFLRQYTLFNDRLSWERKVMLTLTVMQHTVMSPVYAFPWILDELIYGWRLDAIELDGGDNRSSKDENDEVAMVFIVSGYRSASTHLARSLMAACSTEGGSTEDEEREDIWISPNSLQLGLPILWMWRMATSFVGELTDEPVKKPGLSSLSGNANAGDAPALGPTLSRSEIRKWYREKFASTPEALERHDFDPLSPDTFDVSFLASHLNALAWQYCMEGCTEVVVNELNYAKHTAENKVLYEEEMVRHIDRLARKMVLFDQMRRGHNDSKSKRTFLLKGHFLSTVPALQQKYPRARFLTVLRDPCARLQSAINYTAVNPTVLGGMNSMRNGMSRWQYLAQALEETEATYCLEEMSVFRDSNVSTDVGKDRLLAIHYESLTNPKKLDKTMDSVCRWLGKKSPMQSSSVNEYHQQGKASSTKSTTKKNKPRYLVDKTLQEVGVNEMGYRKRLSDYYRWMDSLKS